LALPEQDAEGGAIDTPPGAPGGEGGHIQAKRFKAPAQNSGTPEQIDVPYQDQPGSASAKYTHDDHLYCQEVNVHHLKSSIRTVEIVSGSAII
jgi:hypothetical protein